MIEQVHNCVAEIMADIKTDETIKKSPNDYLKLLHYVYGGNVMSHTQVYVWHKQFAKWNVENDKWSNPSFVFLS